MAHDMRRRAAQQDQTAELLELVAARAGVYLSAVERRAVAPDDAAVRALARFDEALPQAPADARAVLELLDDVGSPATLATAGPRFFGFVIGGALPVTVAASWLATAWDQNAGAVLASPVGARLEAVAEGWLNELLGLPRDAVAAFVTGATVANFTALAAARHAVLARAGWDVEADGLFGAPPVTVVLGAEVHPSVRKSLGMLGLGRTRVVELPVDGQGRILAAALPRLAPPCIVVLQAGNVNTGAFDPFAGARALGAPGRRLGARGRRLRPVGGGRAGAARAARRRGRGRLLGHRCAQVAQRALRQRPRLRRRPAGAACGHGGHRRLPALQRDSASPRRSRRSCRGARAASRCGPRCVPWAATAWRSWWSAAAATRGASPRACAGRVSRC